MNKEEAIKILRELHDKALFSERTALETLHPELKESEDERVRKAILELVRQSSEVLDKQNQNNMIAWLEKQCYTKKDVDDAYLKGICYTKHELEKQGKHTDEDMVEALRTEYEKGRADTIAEMEKDWSEEDDVMINKLLAVVKLYYDRSGDDLDKQSCISFLKSLKDKVQPQPQQKWSEEDEHLSYWTIHNLTELKNRFGENYGDSGKCIDWIKQLKQRIGG